MAHIPYENFDVQLGRRLTLAPEDAFDKLVTRRRGGWCYEMNGLLRWALTQIGFEVLPMSAGVRRAERGDSALGNHLALMVRLERGFIVEAGLGDGPGEPFALPAGADPEHGREGWREMWREDWREMRLECVEGGWWRFVNHPTAFASSFDFRCAPADWALLERKCTWLQTDPDSVFVQNAVCARPSVGGFSMLVGRVLKTVSPAGTANRILESAEEYGGILRTVFGLDLPEAMDLWPAILRRHEALFGQ